MARTRYSLYSKEYKGLLTRLREARAGAAVTQVELAKRLRTEQSVISKLERGVVRMDLLDLISYLRAIDADPVQFVAEVVKDLGSERGKRR
jgi:transcriptional regulator with XRE-family HTH domain